MQAAKNAKAAYDAKSAVNSAAQSATAGAGTADAAEGKQAALLEEQAQEKADNSGDDKDKKDVKVWEWLDDLLEGFAVIYTSTVAAGHQCTDCVHKGVYPIKEQIITRIDQTTAYMAPTTDQRMGAGGLGLSATFAHDDFG
mmetsp:Transcript_123324/g.217394  ORF Transcript_123324/g.217394 Transcript_123324/m.217394 type:complete len:141 (+) Transcript_123324:1-423(+)